MGEKVISDDCDFGWVTVWASEMGDAAVLDGLLRHADRFMHPHGTAAVCIIPETINLRTHSVTVRSWSHTPTMYCLVTPGSTFPTVYGGSTTSHWIAPSSRTQP
jgi:hypothetical protein